MGPGGEQLGKKASSPFVGKRRSTLKAFASAVPNPTKPRKMSEVLTWVQRPWQKLGGSACWPCAPCEAWQEVAAFWQQLQLQLLLLGGWFVGALGRPAEGVGGRAKMYIAMVRRQSADHGRLLGLVVSSRKRGGACKMNQQHSIIMFKDTYGACLWTQLHAVQHSATQQPCYAGAHLFFWLGGSFGDNRVGLVNLQIRLHAAACV